VKLIHDAAPGDQPFFLWTTYTAPHYGYGTDEPDDPPGMRTPVPGPRDRNKFAKEPLPTPPSFDEADVSDKPTNIRKLRRITPRRRAAIRENYQQELETLQAVDRGVARIVAALEATGQLDRTLIVFTSDNGYFHGEHRISREKTLPYEPAIRVPLIVRGPGLPHGVHRAQFVSNQDLASTFLDVAGAEAGLPQDGMSLIPLIHRPHLVPGRDLLIEGITSINNRRVDFAGIRGSRWVYTEYTNGERELYDLRNDPYELASRAGGKKHAAIEQDLAERLTALRTCAGANCLERPQSPRAGKRERARGYR
jgi:N-acetylglucosamine-6-sulfatase